MTKKPYGRAEGYDESLRLGEDTDFGERVKKLGGEYRYIPAPVLPSERKFREHGYFSFAWGVGKESIIYIFSKKAHRRIYGN